MEIRVNESVCTVADAASVEELLAELGVRREGVAVAVNGEVVRRGDWPERRLTEQDAVLIITATQGG